MKKKILFICRHAPYGSSLAKDALDAILASSAYDQKLSVLFIDDGVFQLVPNQCAGQINQKSFSALLPVLALYEVDSIYVHSDSIEKRQLNSNDLILENASIIDSKQVNQLLAQQDQILSF